MIWARLDFPGVAVSLVSKPWSDGCRLFWSILADGRALVTVTVIEDSDTWPTLVGVFRSDKSPFFWYPVADGRALVIVTVTVRSDS
jgi:hypothetical protein